MMNETSLQIPVLNTPPEISDKYVVVTINKRDYSLWYYGEYDDLEEAKDVADQVNGFVSIYEEVKNDK
jgi:hypothetical protein